MIEFRGGALAMRGTSWIARMLLDQTSLVNNLPGCFARLGTRKKTNLILALRRVFDHCCFH